MNRKEIKERALSILENNFFRIWIPFFLLILIFCFVDLLFAFFSFSSDLYETILYLIVINLFVSPFNVGLCYLLLKIIKNEKYNYKSLFKFYPKFINIFLINLVIQLFFSLGLIVFVVPAFMVLICYSFVGFVVAEGEYSVVDSLREARELIYGYKFDYFKFLLSFFGWFLIVILTFGTAVIFVLPYFALSNTIYYNKLKNKKLNI